MNEPTFPKQCNEYFDFIGSRAVLAESSKLFASAFLVKKPVPARCFIFEHFPIASVFYPTGNYPLVPTSECPRLMKRAGRADDDI